MAQIIVSVQMVYEERVINRRNVAPLAAVGWEGMHSLLLAHLSQRLRMHFCHQFLSILQLIVMVFRPNFQMATVPIFIICTNNVEPP